MDRPNLFTLAAENEPKFPARFEEICRDASEERVARLQGFSDRVARDGRVSVNMRSWKLRALLDAGP